jgi:hypothetical protein
MKKSQDFYFGKKKEKKEYEIVKNNSYNIDDFRDIVDHFNEKLNQFAEQLLMICKENKWRKEADDLASYNELVLLSIKSNRVIAIQHFINKFFPYWEFIKANREDIFLNDDYKDVVDDNVNSLEKIMQIKKLWLESGLENKEYIFGVLNYLCYCCEHYEEVGLTTGYVKKQTTIIPIQSDDVLV